MKAKVIENWRWRDNQNIYTRSWTRHYVGETFEVEETTESTFDYRLVHEFYDPHQGYRHRGFFYKEELMFTNRLQPFKILKKHKLCV